MKLFGIIGTNAKKSDTRTLLEFMQKHYQDQAEIELVEINTLPLFNESKELSQSDVIKKMAEKLSQADGFIISTSEHNQTITAALKSFLEWMSYDYHPFQDKPLMIVGTSTRYTGSATAQIHLREILEAPGVDAFTLPGNEFLLGNSEAAFDEAGQLKDEKTVAVLDGFFKKFMRFAKAITFYNMPEEIHYQEGSYDVVAQGHNGKVPMKVTFSNDRIEAIEVDRSGETEGIADVVFDRLPDEIVAGQTLNVDAISGASVTSRGILDGVAQAVQMAGGDPDILKRRPKPSAKMLTQEELTTDVAVVGGGGAGLAAAATAIQQGKKVILLEKFPALGGNTVRAGGPMNAADPDWQKTFKALPGEDKTLRKLLETDEATIDPEYLADFKELKKQLQKYLDSGADYLFDSNLLHEIQTYLGGKRVDLQGNEIHGQYDLVKKLIDNCLDSVKWLEDIGVEFDKSQVTMPVGALWRRGHKPIEGLGFAFIKALKKWVLEHGGMILTETPVVKLRTKDGAVCGLVGRAKDGHEVIVHTRGGVVLASGGFGANTKMVQKYNTYWKEIADDIATSNSPAITGDGIKLGVSVGADLVGMGFTQMMPVSDPKTGALFTGIQCPPANYVMVNQQGKRFVDEYAGRDVLSKAAFDNGGLFYLIADDAIKDTAYNTSDEQLDAQVAAGTLFRADTLEDLAKQINVDPQTLVDTVAKYNQYVDQGQDPEFGKEVFDLKVVKPPFYATPRRPAIHHTMGGLKIDTEAHVLDKNGHTIKGLYAAGEVAGGIHAGNRLGGNSLADIFTYGRFAGINAAKDAD